MCRKGVVLTVRPPKYFRLSFQTLASLGGGPFSAHLVQTLVAHSPK